MEWKRISNNKPPINKELIVAYGYIYDDNDYSINGYKIITFEKYDLNHLKISNNGKYCTFKGNSIAFFSEIISPTI